MKKIIISFFLALSFTGFAQTATNFTCADCSGTTYDLFTVLDSGKIVVICWVMPCGSCVNPSVTTYNVVESYQSTHPGKVFFYLTDDFANTTCPDLISWANTNNITESSFSRRFSNSAISMSDYGTFGMPKIVVLGGTSHTVFYNVNDVVSQTDLTNAIDLAIAATGISDKPLSDLKNKLMVYPSPACKYIDVSFDVPTDKIEGLKILNAQGICVKEQLNAFIQFNSKLTIDISDLNEGLYFIRLITDKMEYTANFFVIR